MRCNVKEFDALDAQTGLCRASIRRCTSEDLKAIYPKVGAAFLHRLATLDICEIIRRRHNDNLWSIHDTRNQKLCGIYAMAMLTHEGRSALLRGEFEPHDPRLAHVAETGSDVSAIYKWGVFAPGIAAAAIPLIANKLTQPDYKEIDLYGNGSTHAGERIMHALGFSSASTPRTPLLYKYQRLATRGVQ